MSTHAPFIIRPTAYVQHCAPQHITSACPDVADEQSPHTDTQAHTRTRTQTHARARTRTRTHAHARAHRHTHAHTHTHKLMCTVAFSKQRAHVCRALFQLASCSRAAEAVHKLEEALSVCQSMDLTELQVCLSSLLSFSAYRAEAAPLLQMMEAMTMCSLVRLFAPPSFFFVVLVALGAIRFRCCMR